MTWASSLSSSTERGKASISQRPGIQAPTGQGERVQLDPTPLIGLGSWVSSVITTMVVSPYTVWAVGPGAAINILYLCNLLNPPDDLG